MNIKNILFCLVFLIVNFSFSQNSETNFFTISGFVSDSISGESLIGVNVYSDSLKLGTSTNNFGFYSLTLPEGEFEIIF